MEGVFNNQCFPIIGKIYLKNATKSASNNTNKNHVEKGASTCKSKFKHYGVSFARYGWVQVRIWETPA